MAVEGQEAMEEEEEEGEGREGGKKMNVITTIRVRIEGG
jgi:hypothetical protein